MFGDGFKPAGAGCTSHFSACDIRLRRSEVYGNGVRSGDFSLDFRNDDQDQVLWSGRDIVAPLPRASHPGLARCCRTFSPPSSLARSPCRKSEETGRDVVGAGFNVP